MDAIEQPDPQRLDNLFRQFEARHRRFLDDLKVHLDKAQDFNKSYASFFERLMLLDLGMIGLSVTVITSLGSKVHIGTFSKVLFLAIIVPGWALLLLSALCCWSLMSHALTANRKIFDQWSESIRFDVKYAVLSATMIAQDLDRRGEQFKGLSDQMKAAVASSQRQMDDEATEANKFQAATKQATDLSEWLEAGSRVAIHGMQAALLLLCIAAVVLVFAM